MLERGSADHYRDAVLYDYEYRRRRDDVRFYVWLARHLGSPVLDLGCGTGRVAAPMVRVGLDVLGLDLSAPMLARAQQRVRRVRRGRLRLVRGDLRSLPLRARFPLVVAAFNTLQHIYRAEVLVELIHRAGELLADGGCFAFDVLNPDVRWLGRDPRKRWGRTRFTHPVSGEPLVYSASHSYDPVSQVASIRIFYEPLPGARGKPRVIHLAHRQYFPEELRMLVRSAGLRAAAIFGGFGGEPLTADSDSQVLLCCRPADAERVLRTVRAAWPPTGS